MGKEASAMVARRSTSRRDWRRWWWWLLPLACCFVCWVASSAATVAPAAGVAVTSLPGFDGPLPFSLETGNIIFVDSPIGAGFSYAATQEGSKTSDTKTVKQLVIFLRKWLHDHPQFLLNPLYIGGDSYSGYIVPTLVLAIDESNDSGDKPILNLMGYVAGNPRTERQFDEGGKIPFLHGMGLISNELYECTKDINMLHVLEPFCEEVWSPGIHNNEATDGMIRLMLESASAANDDIIEFKRRKASYVVLKIWANDKTVRESLGVHKYHLTLMRKGYRALIYSGDHDCQVPFTGTQAWIRFLNLSVVDDWRPWYAAGQVAGFTRSYANNNLIYATVKGAGHTAPEYKPKECLEMRPMPTTA
uniref:Uncharacterized protein n=1 Tax=Oryza meridionalis TaxID=40149 RepID=A0A0E0F5I4_9ORYZ